MIATVSTCSGATLVGGTQRESVGSVGSHPHDRSNPFTAVSSKSIPLVIFQLDELRYALRLPVVERVVRCVEITPLPKAPEIVLGIVNVQGGVIPVVNLRKRFRLPEREISLNNHLIIARTSKRTIALITDAAFGIIQRPEDEVTASDRILPGLEYVEGVVKFHDGLIFVHDLGTFLSLEEGAALEEAITACQGQQ